MNSEVLVGNEDSSTWMDLKLSKLNFRDDAEENRLKVDEDKDAVKNGEEITKRGRRESIKDNKFSQLFRLIYEKCFLNLGGGFNPTCSSPPCVIKINLI